MVTTICSPATGGFRFSRGSYWPFLSCRSIFWATGCATPSIRNCADMPEPLLRVENLRVELPTRRGALTAIDDISFAIAPGEVLGVVGESGAGKSLTGAAIIGLLEPPLRIAGGRITLAGRRIDNLPNEAMRRIRGREIGAIFQDPLTSLNPLYTIGRQLIETIRTHLDLSPAAARDRALALLGEVGIAGAETRIDQKLQGILFVWGRPARDSLIRRINSLMARFNSLLRRNKFPVPMRRELRRKPLNCLLDCEPTAALGGPDEQNSLYFPS